MTSFKKAVSRPTARFFKKATGEVGNFFKKGGQFQQGAKDVASALGKTGEYLSKGAKIGNQIVGAVEKSPFGSALSPALAVAKTGLNVLSMAGKTANAGRSVANNIVSGKSASSIVSNTLEKAKELKDESKGIKFA